MNRMNRDTMEIKVWMMRNGFRFAQVARDLGVSRAAVARTIHGHRDIPRILRRLLELGCPREILGLPEKMKNEEVEA